MAVKKSKSRGRDLKHTETQAGIDISRKVSGERGRTDGVEKLGAVSAASPKLRRKAPATFRSHTLTKADIESANPRPFYPDELHVTKDGRVKMHRYFVDPNTLK